MSGSPRWEKESELALRAVATTGELITERPERLAYSTKESARDLVTELDLQIERQIAAVLGDGFPIVGEETSPDALPVDPDAGHWLVDPIDGTTNLICGLPYFAVSVGLRVNRRFVIGAVSVPALKELFFTYGDRGAFLNGRPLHAPSSGKLSTSLVAASFSGTIGDPEQRRRQYQLFGEVNDAGRGCLRLGSAAVNICYVAAGRLQAAYGLCARPWDIAGALAVAQQAGCAVALKAAPSGRVDYAVGAVEVVQALRALMDQHGFPLDGEAP